MKRVIVTRSEVIARFIVDQLQSTGENVCKLVSLGGAPAGISEIQVLRDNGLVEKISVIAPVSGPEVRGAHVYGDNIPYHIAESANKVTVVELHGHVPSGVMTYSMLLALKPCLRTYIVKSDFPAEARKYLVFGKPCVWAPGGVRRYQKLTKDWGWDAATSMSQEIYLLRGNHGVDLHDNMLQIFSEQLVFPVS
jgi:hypothetical protein